MAQRRSIHSLAGALAVAALALPVATLVHAADTAGTAAAGASNPCAASGKRMRGENPCSAGDKRAAGNNPCAAGGKRSRADNPCSANPCVASSRRKSKGKSNNPCAAN